MLHKSAAEHHQKLLRVLARIEQAVHRDDLDDFFKTAYHLLEITEADPQATPAQKAAAAALRGDQDLQVCRDIANRQKHFKVDPKRNPAPKAKGAAIHEGYGIGRYGRGAYGAGEQRARIHLSDGTQVDALDLVRSVAAKWAAVFPS